MYIINGLDYCARLVRLQQDREKERERERERERRSERERERGRCVRGVHYILIRLMQSKERVRECV